jgi:intergrase/recombinase
MSNKIISIEKQKGAYKKTLERVMRMVPERDKNDKRLKKLIAFRLRLDGEAALSEYLIQKIRDAIKCSYTGSLYDYIKDDVKEKECKAPDRDSKSPGAA